MNDYNWPGPFTPYEHQMATTKFMIDNPRGFVLNDMGTGKTASTLWALDYLIREGFVRRALIVAPLSTLRHVWRDEAFRLLTHRRTQLLYGSSEKRKSLYEERWDIGIINYDGIKVLYKQLMADGTLDAIVIDEATAYRNSLIDRWDMMHKLSAQKDYLWLLTGTPTPQAPTDAFGLAKMVGNNLAPKFFGAWRRATMFQVSEHKWTPKPDGYDKAFAILQPAVRFKKEDCIDLPPITYQEWEVELSLPQRKAYRNMQKAMKIDWDNYGDALPAVNAADKINKLRQIACGVVRDTRTDEYIGLPCRPRIDATLEAIEMAAAKTIVVVPFVGAMRYVTRELSKHYTTAMINGSVSQKQRDEIINAFRYANDPRVLVVHPKVMAHGLTLIEADTMVFYAPIYSNEQTQQIVQRINRPGQTRSMTVVRIAAVDLEWQIYKAVEQRAKGEAYLLSLYNSARTESLTRT